MIKFFRKIRKQLLTENKFNKYVLYAIGEIILVVIGILIALQINNWNEERKENKQERFILQKLLNDLNSDIADIDNQISVSKSNLLDFKEAANILLNNEVGDINTFNDKISNVLNISGFNQKNTTFSNLISTGKIELIKNQALSDSIVIYYNSDYASWDTAMKDYTRNIIAPYLLKFDHIPEVDYKSDERFLNKDYSAMDISKSDVIPKSLNNYKQDVFFSNILRQKIRILEGQNSSYQNLRTIMYSLVSQIKKELND
ncbi:DUF6090 family protein [Cellulophaga sp. Hel_I_12]|uniref:DUF6090 family protein n=1 Tax=Cellulophaga sp. Hel_I_12 TaxID=1249972 RepID=UPI0006897BAA|nr:DUF6090 family protein [Cellulophaga sp. Hel_I_12]